MNLKVGDKVIHNKAPEVAGQGLVMKVRKDEVEIKWKNIKTVSSYSSEQLHKFVRKLTPLDELL